MSFRRQATGKADQLRKENACSFERTFDALVERAQKAEKLADEIETKLEKLHGLKDEGRL
jgi:hypothetical protein